MKKILKVLGVLLLLFIIVLIAVPFLFQDRIVQTVKDNVNESLNAKVDFGDFNLTLFANFPDFTFEIEDITVDGIGAFDSTRLASLGTTSFTLDVMSVIKGDKVKIKGISIDDAYLQAIVLEDGTANYDIIKESDGEDAEAETDVREEYIILLEEYAVTNSEIIYDNRALAAYIHLDGFSHSGDGKLTDKRYDLNTITNSETVDISYEGVGYLQKAVAQITANFDVQDNFREINLKENVIKLNELFLEATGQLLLPEDGMDMDIAYKATQTDLKTILSLVPAAYMPDLSGLSTTGNVDLGGQVKGHYDDFSFPAFNLNTKISDGRIQYPDLPEDIEDIQLDMLIDFPGGGTDFNTTTIDLRSLRMKVAESPINASLLLKEMMTDPYMKSSVKAQLNLGRVKEAVAMEGVEDLQGIITADVDMEGRMSAIEQERYQDFKAIGQVILQDFIYYSDSMSVPVQINTAHLNFSPQQLELASFKGKLGETDMRANGSIDNYIAYYLRDETLKGRFDVACDKLDMNEFLTDSEEPVADAAASDESMIESEGEGIIAVPGNVDFAINARINDLRYEDMVLKNIRGQVLVKDKVASMSNVRMDVLGGEVILDGNYDTKDVTKPLFDFGFKIAGMDIPSTAATFNTVEKLAPVAKLCTGDFSSNFTMKAALDGNMNPVMSSVAGGGNLTTADVVVENIPALLKIADALKLDNWKSQGLNNVKMAFKMEDGKLIVSPFDVKLDGMEAVVGGSMTFEQELDYNVGMKVPVAKLGNDAGQLLNGLVGQANDLGLNLSVGEFVNMNFKVTGTMTNPMVKPSVVGQEGGSVKDVIKDTIEKEFQEAKEEVIEDVKEDAREQADKLMAEARKQAEAIRAEAKRAADKTREEGNRAADKLEADANGPFAKAGAKIAADKLRKEADKKAVQIEEEADKKAQSVVDKAQTRADELLK
jgi:predicted ester cyclase